MGCPAPITYLQYKTKTYIAPKTQGTLLEWGGRV